MQKEKGHYTTHVFVCTNQKKGDCCAEHGAEEFRKELKSWAKDHPEWKNRVRINNSGCLDRCKEGIAIAIYPQGEWLLNVRHRDIDAVKAEIESLVNIESDHGNDANNEG